MWLMYRRAEPTRSTLAIRRSEFIRELIPSSLLRGKRAERNGFVPLRREDSPQLAAESFNYAGLVGVLVEAVKKRQARFACIRRF